MAKSHSPRVTGECNSRALIWYAKKIHFLLSQIEKKNENMKKKKIRGVIDYACLIIIDNRL